MQSFSFPTTRAVLCEIGATARMGEIIAACGCRKVAFVTDEVILKHGLADPALAGLRAAGVEPWVFSRVVTDPPEAMILEAVKEARQARIDDVVSIGGGSSLDTAKLIAILVGSDQPLAQMYGVGLVKGDRLPLVPNAAGTGSEVTPIAIVTTGPAEKKGVSVPQLMPDGAILVPELTVGLPACRMCSSSTCPRPKGSMPNWRQSCFPTSPDGRARRRPTASSTG
jgi:alcohol dehydrogenase class IV